MAPVDKYFALVRRRIKAFDRGARPTSGETIWYVNAFYDPRMIEKVATIFRFYYNYMLPESAESGRRKAERQTPAMKIGTARGLVYVRDFLASLDLPLRETTLSPTLNYHRLIHLIF